MKAAVVFVRSSSSSRRRLLRLDAFELYRARRLHHAAFPFAPLFNLGFLNSFNLGFKYRRLNDFLYGGGFSVDPDVTFRSVLFFWTNGRKIGCGRRRFESGRTV